jgi:uncharacterized repeat protein (TIGR03803 family)
MRSKTDDELGIDRFALAVGAIAAMLTGCGESPPPGGASDDGTVFSITTEGTETILHSFAGKSDGSYPVAGLIDVNGTLHALSRAGGQNAMGFRLRNGLRVDPIRRVVTGLRRAGPKRCQAT